MVHGWCTSRHGTVLGMICEGHACIEGATCIECSGAESTAVRSECTSECRKE